MESWKASRVDKPGCTWDLSGENRYNALWTNGKARRVRFLFLPLFRMALFLAPNVPGFWPLPISICFFDCFVFNRYSHHFLGVSFSSFSFFFFFSFRDFRFIFSLSLYMLSSICVVDSWPQSSYLSSMNQHGHGVCWMSTGRKNGLGRATQVFYCVLLITWFNILLPSIVFFFAEALLFVIYVYFSLQETALAWDTFRTISAMPLQSIVEEKFHSRQSFWDEWQINSTHRPTGKTPQRWTLQLTLRQLEKRTRTSYCPTEVV